MADATRSHRDGIGDSVGVPVGSENVRPGTILHNRRGGFVTIARRKEDGSGWWNTDLSGFSDEVLDTNPDWSIVPATEVRCPTCLRHFDD